MPGFALTTFVIMAVAHAHVHCGGQANTQHQPNRGPERGLRLMWQGPALPPDDKSLVVALWRPILVVSSSAGELVAARSYGTATPVLICQPDNIISRVSQTAGHRISRRPTMPARPRSPPEGDRSRRSPPRSQHDLRLHETARTFLAVMDVASNQLLGG